MPNEFLQLGVSGLTLGILYFIIRYFVAALREKDTYLENNNLRTQKLIEDFRVHVELCNTNFLKTNTITTKALRELTTALQKNMPVVTDNTAASIKNTEAIKTGNGNGGGI